MATYYPKASLEFLPADNLTSIDLCYTFHVYCLEGGSSGKYYVDAADGRNRKFLAAETNCESTSFTSNFNGNQTIATVDVGDEYELEDDCHDSVYGVYDENNNSDIFTDATNTWNTDWQRSAATSLWAIKQSYYAYLGEFNLSGHDGDDGNLDIYQAHFFPNGGNNNASFHYDFAGDDEINVGIGNTGDVTDDYNTLDILGHEFTHGVDEYSAELEYVGESGALDESFADIFGEWIENHSLGTNDWFLGAERLAGNNCPDPLRYFVDPGAQNVQTVPNCQSDFGQPNTYQGNNWYPIGGCDPEVDTTDNCGVHTNSGVQNQMFYLLVEGGSGWNDGNTCHASVGSGYPWEVDGIGMEDAITIGYYAHVTMLGPNADYQDARHAWVATAAALYGECSNQAIQAGKAWYAVGFNPPSVPDYIVCNIEYGNNPVTIEQSGRIRTGDGCVVVINDGGSLVTFSAGLNVVLKPGFEAIGGSRFRAIVTDCDFARY